MQGLLHRSLHLAVFAITFVMFLWLGLALQPLSRLLLTLSPGMDVLFACAPLSPRSSGAQRPPEQRPTVRP